MFEVKNINKTYDGKTVLDNVSLKVENGKLTGLIGSNGAGKSTLLSIMSRLTKQDCGEVFFNDKLIAEYKNSELAKLVAVLRQSNNLNIRLTIRELVSFGRYPHTKGRLKPSDAKIIDDALAFLSLTDMQNKFIDELSGGERQRALIAMVVAQDTDCILLDEPLNNLDMKHANAIMKTLRDLVDKTNRTVVVVLHDINCAAFYCDQIVALKDCKIFHIGTPDEIMTKEIIDHVFDIDCQIHELCNHKICVHYK